MHFYEATAQCLQNLIKREDVLAPLWKEAGSCNFSRHFEAGVSCQKQPLFVNKTRAHVLFVYKMTSACIGDHCSVIHLARYFTLILFGSHTELFVSEISLSLAASAASPASTIPYMHFCCCQNLLAICWTKHPVEGYPQNKSRRLPEANQIPDLTESF